MKFQIGIGFIILGIIWLMLPGPLFADSSSFSNADKDRSDAPSPYHAREVRNTITKRQNMLQTCYLNFLKTKPEKTDGMLHLDWMQRGQNALVFRSRLEIGSWVLCPLIDRFFARIGAISQEHVDEVLIRNI